MVVLTANLPPRQPSTAARWALWLALFIPVLFLTAIIAHNIGLIDTAVLLTVLAAGGGLGVLGVVMCVIGLRSLWVHGRKGGRRLSWAVLLLLPVVVVYTAAALATVMGPATMQASTDAMDPPLFISEFGDDRPDTSAVAAADPRSPGSTLENRRYGAPMTVVLEQVAMVAAQAGWQRRAQRGRIGADDRVLVDYQGTVPLTRIGTELVVRLTDEGDTVRVDARLRSPEVPNDLGYSRWAVDRFLRQLDMAMAGLVAF